MQKINHWTLATNQCHASVVFLNFSGTETSIICFLSQMTAVTGCCPKMSSLAPLCQNMICVYMHVIGQRSGQKAQCGCPIDMANTWGKAMTPYVFHSGSKGTCNYLSESCPTSGLWSEFLTTDANFWVWSSAAVHFLLAGAWCEDLGGAECCVEVLFGESSLYRGNFEELHKINKEFDGWRHFVGNFERWKWISWSIFEDFVS